ncbi:hypothetical protein [Dactylosporangium sp. NPDC000521]|uniref:hypothetical protein n=1 Tax=Dactylosporangium sp. NPDC000521 TaxID=3363975 RepID=UPI0036A1CA62
MTGEMSRRRVLTTAALAGAGAALLPAGRAGAAPPTWPHARSANGWPILEQATWHPIEGSGQRVQLADGGPAVILTYVARRLHYELDQLRPGDVVGVPASRRVTEAYESNALSGTAITFRANAYPLGVTGGFYPAELVVIRDILAELDGVVTWGGDLPHPKESHFQIAHGPGHPAIRHAAGRVLGTPGAHPAGPRSDGTLSAGSIDAHEPGRRARADAYTRRNR